MNAADPQIDLTLTSGRDVDYVEILTDAGIVRVNVGAVTTRDNKPAVIVEVEPNTPYGTKTAPGGDWATEVRTVGFRTDVVLIRQDVAAEAQS